MESGPTPLTSAMKLATLWPIAKNPRLQNGTGQLAFATAATDLGCCILLAAIPIIMSAINSDWLYTGIGWLDPWYNVAYFLHYSDPTFLNSYYKSARLSWIVPGFAAYHVFTPVLANYLLHMGCLLISVVLFFLTVSRLFNSTIAFATAVCFAAFTPFHGSGGWDYQNAPAGAYYVLTFYLLTNAVLANDMRMRLLAAGAAYAGALHATISFVNMAPILAAHFIVLYRHQFFQLPPWRIVLRAAVWSLFGAIALTVALGLVNVAIGRDFIFFQPMIDIVINYVGDNNYVKQWWLPWSSYWFLQVNTIYYVSCLAAALTGCTATVIFAVTRGGYNRIALSLQVQFMFVGFLWIFWQSVGQVALQPNYFPYPLYPVMFFALAGLAATWRSANRRGGASWVLWLFIAFAAIVSLSVGQVGAKLLDLFHAHIEAALAAWALLFVALFAISSARPMLLAAGALAFFALNSIGEAAVQAVQAVREDPYALESDCRIRASAYSALIEANHFLFRAIPSSQGMFVWWNENEVLHDRRGCTMRLQSFSASMTSFGLRYLAPPWEGMPEPDALPAESIAALAEGDPLAIATSDPENVARIVARYARDGINLVIEEEMEMQVSRFAFKLYVLKNRDTGS